jgi:hypothetical protein
MMSILHGSSGAAVCLTCSVLFLHLILQVVFVGWFVGVLRGSFEVVE